MLNKLILTGSVLCAVASWGLYASAEAKPRKPFVCAASDFRAFEDPKAPKGAGKTVMVGVCTEGKRPRLMTHWTSVTTEDAEGNVAHWVVGN